MKSLILFFSTFTYFFLILPNTNASPIGDFARELIFLIENHNEVHERDRCQLDFFQIHKQKTVEAHGYCIEENDFDFFCYRITAYFKLSPLQLIDLKKKSIFSCY